MWSVHRTRAALHSLPSPCKHSDPPGQTRGTNASTQHDHKHRQRKYAKWEGVAAGEGAAGEGTRGGNEKLQEVEEDCRRKGMLEGGMGGMRRECEEKGLQGVKL